MNPRETIERYVTAAVGDGHLTLVGAAESDWDLLVPSYWKETVAVSLHLGDRTLKAEAFFMRAPEDNAAEAYRLLLQRNERGGPWRFCANDSGDATLVALVPLDALTEEELDRLLGTLVTMTDETYKPYMELAFQRGLEDQVRRGGPGLDKPPPWAT